VERAGVEANLSSCWTILKAEKDLFCKVEGGDELYRLLCETFRVKEDEKP